MPYPRAHDDRALRRFLVRHYAVRDRATFIAEVITALLEVVPAESCWFREFSFWPPRVTLVVYPNEVKQKDSERALAQCLDNHPGIAYRQRTLDLHAIQLSDFVTTPRFHRTAMYQQFYRPMGVEYQISVGLSMGPASCVVIALGRKGSDFSVADRRCLNMLLPHLIEGYQNACSLSTYPGFLSVSAPGADDTNVVSLNHDMRVRLVPPGAEALLTEYLGNRVASGHVPDSFERWFRRYARSPTLGRRFPEARKPFLVERPGKRLVVRLCSDENGHSLFPQEEVTDHLLSLRVFGFTAREAQILKWVAQGGHNLEIGVALKIEPRTVSKHLERIFLKLRVDNRTSAVLKALNLTSWTAPPPPRR